MRCPLQIVNWIDPFSEPSVVLTKTTKLKASEGQQDKMFEDDLTSAMYRSLDRNPTYSSEAGPHESLKWTMHESICMLLGDGRLLKLAALKLSRVDPKERHDGWRAVAKWIKDNKMGDEVLELKKAIDDARGKSKARSRGHPFFLNTPTRKNDVLYRMFDLTGLPWEEVETRSRSREYEKLAKWAVMIKTMFESEWDFKRKDRVLMSAAFLVRSRLANWLRTQSLGTDFLYWFTPLHSATESETAISEAMKAPMKHSTLMVATGTRSDHKRQLQEWVNHTLKMPFCHVVPHTIFPDQNVAMAIHPEARKMMKRFIEVSADTLGYAQRADIVSSLHRTYSRISAYLALIQADRQTSTRRKQT